MEFRKVLALRGPNVWASFPILEVRVDLQELKNAASNEMAGFNDRLQVWLPSLIEHRCSVGERGGFFERLRRGTYLAHILEHVVLELQTLAGSPAGFGRTRQTAEDGVYKVALEYEHEELARAALEIGRELCLAAAQARPFDVEAEIVKLRELAGKLRPAPAVAAILHAARARRIPARLLDANGLIQLGQGARQRRVLDGQTDRTSAVAGCIAYDRDLTASLLQTAGTPTPEGYCAATAEEAVRNAEYLGWPVVLKPRYASGRGNVYRPLTNRAEVEQAFAAAADAGWSARIERHVPGNEYRLLVVGERVAAAFLRKPAETPDTPRPSVDVTDRVHAETAARAVEAARAVGLEVAALDVVAADIDRPLEEQNGAVVTLHGQPDLRPFLQPTEGSPPPIGEALLRHIFPDARAACIPVIAVTGTNGKTTTTRLAAHILGQVYSHVGMTCTEGIYVGNRCIAEGDCSGPKSARQLLQHFAVEAAALETARGGILREGLGFDHCDIAVVTNIGEGDHLGAADIDTPEQLAWLKSTLVAAVKPEGAAVLNAADPLVAAMAGYCRGHIIYFARQPDHPVLVSHRAAGGRAAFVRDRQIVLAEGPRETVLLPLERVPLTRGGHIGFHVENALAAAAAAWGLGLSLEALRAGLESFAPTLDRLPARFNLFDIQGTTVVLDYGHNVSALGCLIEAIAPFPHPRRSIVYSAAGDRRDRDLIEQGEQLGNAFDRVILYEDTYLRGRKEGDIFALFRQGLARGRRARDIVEVRGGMAAIETALASRHPHDLLVIQPDIIDDAVEYLHRLRGQGAREIAWEEALLLPDAIRERAEAAIEVREDRLGKSAFAARAFERGHVLARYWGPDFPQRTRHTIQVDFDRHILPPSPLVYFNHACTPNCGLIIRRGKEEMQVHALRPIAVGEELTLDYDTFEFEVKHLTGPCLCQTANCRGAVRGFKHLNPELREAYGPYIAEYLRDIDDPNLAPVPARRQPALRY